MNIDELLARLDTSSLSDRDKLEILELLEARERFANENKLAAYKPYKKQKDFHAAGAGSRERLFMAGNQIGKTFCQACEIAFHLTGDYPDWWGGKVWNRGVAGWAAGVTGESTRDTLQRLLLGRPGQFGTGAIPKSKIIDTVSARGVSDLVDTVRVQHRSGDVSVLMFKSYEKGREKWQGETLDFVAYDEEPPLDIYIEGLTRTNATQGIVWITFTPLLGMSDVVRRFIVDKSPGTTVVAATIDDAEHYTQEQRDAIIATYPPHEREARARGIPTLGSGRVFPISEEAVAEPSIQIPDHWPRICGMDFGWDHPTAAAWVAWDRDTDTVHVYDAYRVKEETPIIHAAAIKARGNWIPVSWPHDGLQHDKGSGEQLADQYRRQGLKMLQNRATFSDGSNGVEAGVMDMLERMQTGRFKVAKHLEPWFEEFRLYHRKDGKLVKVNDDLISATRYAVMMLRYAKTKRESVGPVSPVVEIPAYDAIMGY